MVCKSLGLVQGSDELTLYRRLLADRLRLRLAKCWKLFQVGPKRVAVFPVGVKRLASQEQECCCAHFSWRWELTLGCWRIADWSRLPLTQFLMSCRG